LRLLSQLAQWGATVSLVKSWLAAQDMVWRGVLSGTRQVAGDARTSNFKN
jgi:hypothetical protein